MADMEAFPTDTAVARPEALMDKTPGLALDHPTDTPDMLWPFWSRTFAVNWIVAPKASSVVVGGDTVREVGVGGSPDGPVPPFESDPQDAMKGRRTNARRILAMGNPGGRVSGARPPHKPDLVFWLTQDPMRSLYAQGSVAEEKGAEPKGVEPALALW